MLSLTQFHLLGNTHQDALSNTAYVFQSFLRSLPAHEKHHEPRSVGNVRRPFLAALRAVARIADRARTER